MNPRRTPFPRQLVEFHSTMPLIRFFSVPNPPSLRHPTCTLPMPRREEHLRLYSQSMAHSPSSFLAVHDKAEIDSTNQFKQTIGGN